MGVISTDKNKIILIYNSKESIGKQTYSYVVASEKDILAIDTTKTEIPGTQWLEIAENLGINISDLIQKKFPNYQGLYDPNVTLNTHDWLKVIKKNPRIVRRPILIIGEQFHQIETPSDFVRIMESNSADELNTPSKEG
ncbi:arsenate reductase family protein [Aquimarina latercula]|uniref:arsenate reductase family protein n=1 Tax=Aquimarina latercula TaxID=987 RepID=UPI0003F785FF|nr:ArsC/Spx/MgsR family protein [Aquimarina latercula]